MDQEGDDVEAIPFYIQVPPIGVNEGLMIRHGDLEFAPKFGWTGDTLKVHFPMFQTYIEARPEGAGLVGAFRSVSRSWGEAELDFAASPVDTPHAARRFPGEATASGDALGRWHLDFPESSDAILNLRAADESGIQGAITFTSGNSIYLAGARYGDTVKLSGFDGTSPYLLTVTLKGDYIQGVWVAGQSLAWVEGFEGGRAQKDAELEGGLYLASGSRKLVVPGADLSAYAGKPTIVELAGSWCVTCKHMAPFLVEVYKENHSKGLEMVTLTYEFTDDEAYNAERAATFKKEYDIPWVVMPVHGDLESIAEILPPNLRNIDVAAFPLSIFLGPDGVIRNVHAGFPAETAIEEHKRVSEEYRHLVADLLAGR